MQQSLEGAYSWGVRFNSECSSGVTFNFSEVDPERAHDVVQDLRAKFGNLDIEKRIVDAARPSRSPLHRGFEWDDSVAAETYREEQARLMGRSFRIVVDGPDIRARKVKIFHHLKLDGDSKTSIMRYDEIMDQPVSREMLLQDCLNELMGWRKRWADLSELADAFEQVDKGIRQAQKAAAE
jgi:hypothetical protein